MRVCLQSLRENVGLEVKVTVLYGSLSEKKLFFLREKKMRRVLAVNTREDERKANWERERKLAGSGNGEITTGIIGVCCVPHRQSTAVFCRGREEIRDGVKGKDEPATIWSKRVNVERQLWTKLADDSVSAHTLPKKSTIARRETNKKNPFGHQRGRNDLRCQRVGESEAGWNLPNVPCSWGSCLKY